MIVKFFKRGTGGSGGVFNYLLGKDRDRPHAQVLRGDIDNQALLIDSLDFKQKYTSGCLSFAETPDEITQEQKEQLMDSFEETIRAGLDADRIAVSWVEHRDKGRLELNFVFANVDLKHGRAFQPYVHSMDKKRVNAWKDMQNIQHGFTDPNDPANKRLMAQRDNLPRDIKDARQAITEGLTSLIQEGVIKSRSDVVQTLTNGGFEVVRETDKAISIKNPNGKRNIRLTGGLYERDFNFSKLLQTKIERASENYRGTARQRYDEAKLEYDQQTARKREYHQDRHGKPKRTERTVKAEHTKAPRQYSYTGTGFYREVPSPYIPSYRAKRKRDKGNSRELHSSRSRADRAERSTDLQSPEIRHEQVASGGRDRGVYIADGGFIARDSDSEKGYQAPSDLLRTSPQDPNIYPTNKPQNTPKPLVNQYEQRVNKPSAESTTSPARDDRKTKENAGRQRRAYSTVTNIIRGLGENAERAVTELAEPIHRVTQINTATYTHLERMAKTSEDLRQSNERLINRHNNTLQRSNSAHKATERVSEYVSTRRAITERYGAIRGQIERSNEYAERNREYAGRNKQVATVNTERAGYAQQINKQVTEQLEQQRQQERSRSYTPRMR